MGDVYFDLANFAVNNGLPHAEVNELLRAYFGDVTPEHERALTLMRFMSDFREAMWGVVQQALSDLDVDFHAYAEQHFERLERTAGERAFRRALA
jgi:thiamine kinase-like enzyme